MNQEPPQSDPPVSSEWDEPSFGAASSFPTGQAMPGVTGLSGGSGVPWGQDPLAPARRAAVLLWVCAGIQIVVFGFLALGCLAARDLPAEKWDESAAMTGVHIPAADLAKVQATMPSVAVILAVIGVVPGVLHLVCAFGVRVGHPRFLALALAVSAVQLGVLGLLAAISVITYLRAPAFLPPILLGGAIVLVPLILAFRALLRARNQSL